MRSTLAYNVLHYHSDSVKDAVTECKRTDLFYKGSFCYSEVVTEQLFVNIVIILVAAGNLGEVFQRIGQPRLLGELLAVLIIRPSIFGLVLPNIDLHVLSNLAVFFWCFLQAWMYRLEIRRAGRTAIAISIITFLILLPSGTCASFLWTYYYSVTIHVIAFVNNCCCTFECNSGNNRAYD